MNKIYLEPLPVSFVIKEVCFMKANDVLRYGTIITDDELFYRCDDMVTEVRIRLFSYESAIYYIKMINGEVEEFKKVGVVG